MSRFFKATYSETAWVGGLAGAGGSASTNLSGTEGGVAVLLGYGGFSASWTAGQTIFINATENPDLAWDWLSRVHGIERSDILLESSSVSNCDCQ
jgi:hypothetical protein